MAMIGGNSRSSSLTHALDSSPNNPPNNLPSSALYNTPSNPPSAQRALPGGAQHHGRYRLYASPLP